MAMKLLNAVAVFGIFFIGDAALGEWKIEVHPSVTAISSVSDCAKSQNEETRMEVEEWCTVTGGTIQNGILNIPHSINGIACRAIGADAFSGEALLTSISIDASVTTIEKGAFSDCSNLVSITFGDMEHLFVSEGAFSNCRSLKDIAFPSGLMSIDEFAFSGCQSLKSVKLPPSCRIMGVTAFMNCFGLEKADIGYAGRYLSSAFIGCTNLAEICVASSNEFLKVSNGVLYSKDDFLLIKFPPRLEVDRYVVNPSTEIISHCAFQCAGLKSIEFPPSLKLIGRGAFSCCTNLTSVVIPESVGLIDDHAFSMCSNLVSVIFKGDKRPEMGEDAFPDGVMMKGGISDKCER